VEDEDNDGWAGLTSAHDRAKASLLDTIVLRRAGRVSIYAARRIPSIRRNQLISWFELVKNSR
jgi:hypothetical protein